MNPQQTLVGIYAEKTNEDWSSEFLLNDGMKMRGRTLESSITFDDDFDDLDLIEIRQSSISSSLPQDPTEKSSFLYPPPPPSPDAPHLTLSLSSSFGSSSAPAPTSATGTATVPATVQQSPAIALLEEEDDDMEDWDDELGIQEEVKESQDLLVDGFRFIMGQTLHEELDWMNEFTGSTSGPVEEGYVPLTIPSRCKIVSQLLHGSEDINLVLYPKSIALYSLKLDHDRRQLMAVELDDWLQTMVSKHKLKVETAMRTKDLAWLNRVQNQEKQFNLTLIRAWSETVSLLWRNKSLHIWDVLLKFSKLLRHFSRQETPSDASNGSGSGNGNGNGSKLKSTMSLTSQDKEQIMLHLSDILRIAAMVDASEVVTGQYTKDGVNRPNLHFKFVLNQQFLGGVKNKATPALTSRTPSLFHEGLKYTILLLPEYMEELAILEIQAACHHCVTMLQHQAEGVSWTPSPFTIFKCYIVLFRVVISAENSLTKKKKKYERQTSKSVLDDQLLRLETLKTTIVCDLFYLLNAYSTLDLVFCPHLIPAIDEIKYSEGGQEEENENENDDDDPYTENEEREKGEHSGRFVFEVDRSHSKSVLQIPSPHPQLEKIQEPHQIDPRILSILNSFQKGHKLDPSTSSSPSPSSPLLLAPGVSPTPSLSAGLAHPSQLSLHAPLGPVEAQRLTKSNLGALHSQQSGLDFLASPDQNNKKTIKQIMELMSDKKVDFFDLFHLFSANNNLCFSNILTSKYRNISRKQLLKPRLSFALCLLNSMGSVSSFPSATSAASSSFAAAAATAPMSIHELIESLFLETLVLLDNLSSAKFNDVAPPILSSFGILVMEKFAERLVKDLKHKFAITCLESALCAHQLIKTGDEKRIFRHLTTFAQEGGDFQKRLLYQSRVLRITKEEGKPNEFVYIANLISKLFIEAGEFQCGERCLRVVSLIHLGCPLASVEFEFIDQKQLEYNILPSGVELPTINIRNYRSNSSPNPLTGVDVLFSKRVGSTRAVCDSQQVTSILHLIDLLIYSNRHHEAIDLCLSLLKRKIYPQGRATVLLTLTKCYLKLRLLSHCESTLDRIALEADEIVSTTLFKPGYQSTDYTGGSTNSSQSTTFTTPTQSNSKFPVARYHRSLKEMGREGVGIKKSPEHLSMRASRPARQKSPKTTTSSTTPAPLLSHSTNTTTNNNNTNNNTNNRTFAASASTVGFVSRACSYTYMLLRGKCRFAADDPEWALYWFQIALALCPKGKWDRRCQVRYLMGRCYSKLCLRCRHDSSWGVGDLLKTRKLVELESFYATHAEEEFRHALNLSKTHTEDIIKQTKSINRIIELHNARLFHDIIISKIPVSDALDGKADQVIRSIDGLCRISLQLSGDTCSPLELLRTLINASELSWLQGNSHQAFSSWCEAKTLLTITYLQPLSTMSWGPTVSKGSDTSRVSFIAGTTDISQFLPDPKNPIGDIPLPAVAYPPGLMTRIYDLLTRIIRLAFYITPCPLSNNGGALLTSWTRLNHAVQVVVEPLYTPSQTIPNRPLTSFSRLFSTIDNEINRMFFPEVYISSAYSTILGVYGLESNPEKLKLAQQFQKERKLWNENFSPVEIPTETIPHLSRPVIPRGSRRLKSIQIDADLASPLLILTHELEETALKDIVQSLCPSDEFVDPNIEHKEADTRRGDHSSKLDGSMLGLVTATAHLLSPFEMARRALVLEFDLGSPFEEAIKATETAVKTIRGFGKTALFSPGSDTADIIKRRSCAPSLTMTPEGYLVNGFLDLDEMESFSPHSPNVLVDNSKHEDLATLLQSVNNIYQHRIEPNDQFEEFIPTLPSHHGATVDLGSTPQNEGVLAYNSLLGCPQSKSRLEVLFMRLRVFSNQYTEGLLSLTEFHKKNMATIKKIVHSQSIGLRSHSESEIRSPTDTVTNVSMAQLLSQVDEEESEYHHLQSPERVRSHSAEIIQALASSASISSCYPQSFRFVIYLDNSLMLFTPHTDTTAVVVVAGNVKMLHKAYSQMREKDEGEGTPQTAAKEVKEDGNGDKEIDQNQKPSSTQTQSQTQTIRSDSSEFEFINPQLISSLPLDEKQRRPSMMPRRHSSSDIQGNRPTNLRKTIKQRPGFKTLPVRKPPKPSTDGQTLEVSLTPPQVPPFMPNDGRLISALSDLPLASEDLYLDGVAYGSNVSRDDESMFQLFRLLGYQNIIFIWTALMLEESVLVVGNPGSEQQLAHVTTALLRLLRPLGWQHLYIPLMHASMLPIFLAVLRNHEPFFISTYREVVKDLIPNEVTRDPFDDFLSGSLQHTLLSTRSNLSDITVVDIETGKVTPGRKLYFAAACTLSGHHGIVPESDPQLLRHLVEILQTMDCAIGAPTLKPSLPARYRLPIFLRLRAALTSAEMTALYPSRQFQSNNAIDVLPNDLIRLLAKEIAECMFNVSISLFKGLYYCVYDSQIDQLATRLGSRQNLVHRREYSASGRYPIEEEKFMLFLKDDVRPFVLYLLHTRSFKKLVLDIHHFKKHRPLAYQGGTIDQSDISPTFARFMSAIELRLERRLQFYTTISTQRIGGYLTTFFTDTNQSSQQEQLFQFLYLFPYTVEAVKKYLQQLKLNHPHHKSAFDQIKIKRRWCVLDAHRLTYFKSRSTSQIKDHINIEPTSVRLITSPYCAPFLTSGANSSLTATPQPIHLQYTTTVTSFTNEGHNCALVFNAGSIMVFRADTIGEHFLWVRALRSRLLPESTVDILTKPSSKEIE